MVRSFDVRDTTEYTYIGRAACGCIRAAVVCDEGRPAWTARHVADMVLSGLVPERVTVDFVRTHGFCRCDQCDPPKSVQERLFL